MGCFKKNENIDYIVKITLNNKTYFFIELTLQKKYFMNSYSLNKHNPVIEVLNPKTCLKTETLFNLLYNYYRKYLLLG